MPHKLVYDWEEIQKYYDEGHSIRDCQGKFGFGSTARLKASIAGRFVVRSQKQALAISRKNPPPEATGNSVSSTTLKGEIACARFDVRAMEKGVIVSRPILECCYDRIADVGGKLLRIQIKYAGQLSDGVVKGKITRTCRTRDRMISYGENEIDVIVVYCAENDKFYWLEKNAWVGRTSISLRVMPSMNEYSNSNKASDFEW